MSLALAISLSTCYFQMNQNTVAMGNWGLVVYWKYVSKGFSTAGLNDMSISSRLGRRGRSADEPAAMTLDQSWMCYNAVSLSKS